MTQRIVTYAIVALLVGVPLVSTIPAMAGGTSTGTSGWGGYRATDNAVWTCGANKYIHVSASVDDNGYVWGHADCSGENADCSSYNGYCHGASFSKTAAAGTGNCRGGGDGGYYTKVRVHCYDSSTRSSASATVPSEVSYETLVIIEGTVLNPSGKICDTDEECKKFTPVCTSDLLTWVCDMP